MAGTVTVRVKQGTLRGVKVISQHAGEYISFRGVPYARPPVGALRFKAPQPPVSWSGIRDAIVEGEICPQRDLYTQKLRGNEDCLFLNVHTPKLPEDSVDPLKPVIVCISGGSFTTGHGNADVFGPDFLLREDLVVVTVNYRVGALGFLRLEEAGISGNAGLKDQVLALRWVKENIASFGGDPNNVTMWGESAGGCAVHYHVLSPMSKGLIERAVFFSGSALVPYALMDTDMARKRAFRLGEVSGLKTDNPEELADHLRNVPAIDLARDLNKVLYKVENQRGEAIPFIPTVEWSPVPGEEVFLPDTPVNIMSNGEFNKIPVMMGAASHEGILLLLLKNLLNKPQLWKVLDTEFEQSMTRPLDINVPRYTDTSRAMAEIIRKQYFGDAEELSDKHLINHCFLLSNMMFNIGLHQTLHTSVQFSPQPAYMMEFAFDGRLGVFKQIIGATDLPGACHGDITSYFFKHFMVNYDLPPESTDIKVQNYLVRMLGNFARTGNPTPKSDTSLDVTWEPATPDNKMAYLEIGEKCVLKSERLKERMSLWAGIYRQYGNKYLTRKPSRL